MGDNKCRNAFLAEESLMKKISGKNGADADIAICRFALIVPIIWG
jgi:hypothetical protein